MAGMYGRVYILCVMQKCGCMQDSECGMHTCDVGYVGVSVVCRHVGCARVGAFQVCRRLTRMSDFFFFSSAYNTKSPL